MTESEAIKLRHSVRQYDDAMMIEDEKLSVINEEIEKINKETGLHIQFIMNEPKAFDSMLAHYGKFSGVTSYFAMIGKKTDNLDELCGYYGEKLVLLCQCLGLNTCWVKSSYSKVKDAYDIAPDEKLSIVITVGYGKTQGVNHKGKTVSDVTNSADVPEWFKAGVESALLAPTAINQQKFSFVYEGGNKVKIKIPKVGICLKIDKGIIKYHFEVGAGKENVKWSN